MSDPISQAKTARETLARALGALQSDASLPASLLAVAEPVAQAMSALHSVERFGLATNTAAAQSAREHVRQALGLLQMQPPGHPAVEVALEAVAGSLSMIFGLLRLAESTVAPSAAAAVGAAYAPAAVTATPIVAPAPIAAPAIAIAPAMEPHVPATVAAPAPPPAPAAYGNASYGSSSAVPSYGSSAAAPAAKAVPSYGASAYGAPPPPPGPSFAQTVQADPFANPAREPPVTGNHSSAKMPVALGQGTAAGARSSSKMAVAGPEGVRPPFDVSLGTNSTSNFYKGLSGNDVVEHGGLFVATYNKLPPLGTPVALHVVLPGGYEFDAKATVSWTREHRGGASDSIDTVPGFGAKFVEITAEARHLIYRYVRNREPLFHDDL